MVPAPVGFQCPQCVRQDPAPRPVTPVGARLTTRPYVTYTLVGLDVAIFALQYFVGVDATARSFGMWPAGIAVYGEWWRLMTSAFLHGSILHLLFNMYVLFALGQTLERILGHGRYIVLFLVAALGGGVASFAFSDVSTLSVGASGAIFGLMGALVVAGRRLRYDITQVIVLIGVNVVIGFMSPGTDWRAHLGGLVTGAAVAAVFVLPEKRHRMLVQVVGVVVIVGLLIAVAAWRSGQIQDLLQPGMSA